MDFGAFNDLQNSLSKQENANEYDRLSNAIQRPEILPRRLAKTQNAARPHRSLLDPHHSPPGTCHCEWHHHHRLDAIFA